MAQLDPRNPVAIARSKNLPWHYFHTHTVSVDILEAAVSSEAPRSIEFDIYRPAAPADAVATIQHPPLFYEYKGKPQPANVPLEEGIARFESGDPKAVLVLDAKSRLALDTIQGLVSRLGTHRVVIHAFAKEFAIEPLPEGVEKQPHWVDESLPLADVIKAATPSGGSFRAGIMLTCRHVTAERLGAPGKFRVLERIVEAAASVPGQFDVVGLWLPGGRAPNEEVRTELLQQGILVNFNYDSEIDLDENFVYPAPYVGMTDFLERATEHGK